MKPSPGSQLALFASLHHRRDGDTLLRKRRAYGDTVHRPDFRVFLPSLAGRDTALASALALGGPVHWRPDPVAHPAASLLTAAPRLTQTIGRAAGLIGVATAVMGIAVDIKEERDQRRREQAMLEERQNVRAEFGRVAQDVEREAIANTEAAIRELLDDPLAEITKERDELNLARQARNHNLGRLNSTSAAVNDLIMRIHNGEPEGSINAGTAAG